jgi:hypothetical protein
MVLSTLLPAPDHVDGVRWRAARGWLSDVPEHVRRHEKEWREHMARQAVDSRPYAPMRSAWEVGGRIG